LLLAGSSLLAQTQAPAGREAGKAAVTVNQPAAKLAINTESKEQLQALPGIGAAYSMQSHYGAALKCLM